jgi:hypothetical protein
MPILAIPRVAKSNCAFRIVALFALAIGASCSATSHDNSLLLRSKSYGCGAVEGLGCGLALQPALEKIDKVEGVDRARVSWDGKLILISLKPGADGDTVVSSAQKVLDGAVRVPLTVKEDAPPASGPAQRWFDSKETIELSKYEAEQVTARVEQELAGEVKVDQKDLPQLRAALRAAAIGAFERAHAKGGGVERLQPEFPEAMKDFSDRIAKFLPPEKCKEVMAAIHKIHQE